MANRKMEYQNFFTSQLPTIDLHGEDRKTAELLVKQFIHDLIQMKAEKGIIIHGIGTGTLKKQVHEVLERDKRVENYYMNFFNLGCTMVQLKKELTKN